MTLDLVPPPEPPHRAGAAETRRLVLVPPLAVSAAQQDFVDERDRLLPRAAVSGERAATALYLILRTHDAELQTTAAGSTLCCVTCVRPGGLEHLRYPCPTAEQALWALAASLR